MIFLVLLLVRARVSAFLGNQGKLPIPRKLAVGDLATGGFSVGMNADEEKGKVLGR